MTVCCAFTPKNLLGPLGQPEVGTTLLAAGFPLDVHDTLNHMPVAPALGLFDEGCGCPAFVTPTDLPAHHHCPRFARWPRSLP